MKTDYKDLANVSSLDETFKIIAKSDIQTKNPHIVEYGKDQKALLIKLMRGLSAWKKLSPRSLPQ